MIKAIEKESLSECAELIKASFLTVAKEFNITEQNAPKYVAFAVTEQKLSEQYENGRKMFAYFLNNKAVGFYSLEFFDGVCELNNLCVLTENRRKGIGEKLLIHSFWTAKQSGAKRMKISIVEENLQLKRWYMKFGFVPTHCEKYEFFPFTCGYMEKSL